MKRVHIVCEGQTEETFVNGILSPHLTQFDVFPVASLIGKPGHKGGDVTTSRMAGDIKRRLLGDRTAWCTTFFDFYGLDPHFVGKQDALRATTYSEKAEVIETALREHVLRDTDDNAIRRFVPYVQMYEFEGLLFSDPTKLAAGLYAGDLAATFTTIRTSFGTPEEINDSRQTAPSKRILALMPGYDKPLYGSLAALEIGLDSIRRECKRFNDWVGMLERLHDA